MRYIISKNFGPDSNSWNDYAVWNKLTHCREYYSIDTINRCKLMNPETSTELSNYITTDFGIELIQDFDFAQKMLKEFPNGSIIGTIKNPKSNQESIPANCRLVGYDIMDSFNDNSLISDWNSTNEAIEDLQLNASGLIDDISYAYDLRDMLHKRFADDIQAQKCEVWAIYKIIK